MIRYSYTWTLTIQAKTIEDAIKQLDESYPNNEFLKIFEEKPEFIEMRSENNPENLTNFGFAWDVEIEAEKDNEEMISKELDRLTGNRGSEFSYCDEEIII